MNDTQNAKKKVIRSVLAVLAEHSARWQGVAKLTAMVAELTVLEKTIDDLVEQQGMRIQGATVVKQQARETLKTMTLAASGMLAAHAGDANPELAARAAVTTTDMLYRREVDALASARRIEQLATDHPQAILDGAQDPEFMAKFSAAIETYANALDRRRRWVVARGVVTEELQKAVDKAGQVLAPPGRRHGAIRGHRSLFGDRLPARPDRHHARPGQAARDRHVCLFRNDARPRRGFERCPMELRRPRCGLNARQRGEGAASPRIYTGQTPRL